MPYSSHGKSGRGEGGGGGGGGLIKSVKAEAWGSERD